ncbi:ABC transporter ATP-binding protein [Aliiruegeria lutimaris]|uniref:Iron(III) transport system ATP-binding protein n=1 Tax=Aliiruegeria lutimaris TaxID=571298 RepID=A0A1G8SQZ9_9RHOB|nr:ABC transporter ATP-binding protein [Aliiruegeria lutimaris]SDJ31659.1 iron(III) transport system ATP-binding protein [Aliiruegeria lutimaris]
MTKGSVRFEGVTKHFDDVVALKPLDLDIAPGTLVTLLGPSGCGKTTTLRLVAGLESPTSGRIFIGDEDVTHLSATYRKVSMVFQSYALFPHMTVAENVGYGLTVKRVSKSELRPRVEEGLAMVGLEGFGDRLPSELSGGQQQRVAVARAIVLEPEVLLLDEPLSNLDAKLRRHVREEIREIQQRLNLTAIYVTHDQEEAMAVSDRIIVMKNAEIAQEGAPADLYERPNSAFIADFIGDANLLPVEVARSGETVDIVFDGRRLTLPTAFSTTGQANLVLRPHQLRLSHEASADSLPAEVSYAAYLGNQVQYTLDTALGEIFAVTVPDATPFRKGDTVHVGFDPVAARIVSI